MKEYNTIGDCLEVVNNIQCKSYRRETTGVSITNSVVYRAFCNL